ncbi:MAG: hypothetical protein ACYS8Z_22640 [Planctomycetota bacterium]|jgi:hypothetical protein
MGQAERKKRRKQFAAEERAVRGIMNEWEPIDFAAPEDEYDYLVHRALSILHGGGTKEQLTAEIGLELENCFGLGPFSATETNPIVDRIWEWWELRT